MPTPHVISPIEAVRAAIKGEDLVTTATRAGLTADDLADAISVYHVTGAAALEQLDASRWLQVRVRPMDLNAVEHTLAVVVGPQLDVFAEQGGARGWWFMRKEPGWRIRLLDADNVAAKRLFNGLLADGTIAEWTPAIYEPETAAFGGDDGMSIVHALFQADTHEVLSYLRRDRLPLGRRELSLLLTSAMLTAAGLDWFERGDVFSRAAAMRPIHVDSVELANLTQQLTKLLAVPSGAESPLFTEGGLLVFAADWREAFEETGRRLARTAASGVLTRGLRTVLAHILIFHWNRLGLSAATQAILAYAAARACIPMD
jgi:thiopeptide-type bacteriocin biosynthesis protein